MNEKMDETEIPENIILVNSNNFHENISGAGVTYLFAKNLNEINKDLAKLAVIGMVGDMIDQDVNRLNNIVLKDAEIVIKKGPLIFSATRSLHKALEFSSSVFIPNVTGSSKGVSELLREAEIKIKENERYRTLLDLSQEEMSRLVTSIILKRLSNNENSDSIIGNIYIMKFFNHQEDAREISAMINACGRLGHADIAIAFCLECKGAKDAAEEVYNNYKHMIVKALRWVSSEDNTYKVEGDGYIILNAKKMIDDSIIGTISSIIASSFMYPEGTVVVGLAQRSDKKIKCSIRLCGKKSDVNIHELLARICPPIGIDYGGHPRAGGCLFPEEKEQEFIGAIEKELNIKRISVKM
jgi:RecJ-like exonuclease